MRKFKQASQLLFQYLLQGMLVLAPILITGWFFFSIFTWLDRLVPIYINLSSNEEKPFYMPGIGFIIIVLTLITVGYFSSFFVVGRMLSFFGHILENTPGVKVIYGVVKDFSEAFAGKKRKFKNAVLVSIYQPELYQIGFITNEDLANFGLKDYVSVYIPNSYAVAGVLFLVKKENVRAIEGVSTTDVMKFAISGGVAEVDD